MNRAGLQSNCDRFGGVASAICVLHCLTISLIPSLLSNVQFLSSYNEMLEWGFFSFALFFALSSLIFNWKNHKNHLSQTDRHIVKFYSAGTSPDFFTTGKDRVLGLAAKTPPVFLIKKPGIMTLLIYEDFCSRSRHAKK